MQVMKNCLIFITIFLSLFTFPNHALACLSITDDFNFPNPTLNANFKIHPDINPFTECWSGTLRIRSTKKNWRLVANRNGPNPTSASGDTNDYIRASDITVEYKIMSSGQTEDEEAILVPPFSSETTLSSIQSGTLIVYGIKKSGNSCSSLNPNYYRLSKNLCLFRDFVFNPGEYSGQVSYLLIAP